MKNYTLELTEDEFSLLKTYIPSITLQNVNAKDAIKVGNIIVGLEDKLNAIVVEETPTTDAVEATEVTA